MRLVCLADISVAPGGRAYRDPDGPVAIPQGRWALAPADATACATALAIKRDLPGTHVEIVALGPTAAAAGLAELVRLGADRVTLLGDPVFAGCDAVARSRILAAYLRTAPFDGLLAGTRAADGTLAEVPPLVAELLDMPYLANVDGLDTASLVDGSALVDVVAGRWLETYRVALPAVLGLRHRHGLGLPHPRLRDAVSDVGDRLRVIDARGLGLNPDVVGASASRTRVTGVADPVVPRPAQLVVACDDDGIGKVHAFLQRQGLA